MIKQEELFIFAINPGSMGVLSVCIKLLGIERIENSGSWGTPVYIRATEEEAAIVADLINNIGASFKVQAQRMP